MGEVDPACILILGLDHRPKLETVEVEGIPLIDFSRLESGPSSAVESLVAEIGDACRNWGFFEVINHGVPPHVQSRFESDSKAFFALPKEEKNKVERDEVQPYGYNDAEHTKNVRDWNEVFDFTVIDPTFIPVSHDPDDKELREIWNRWPQNLPEMKECCLEYAAEMEKLALRVIELLALSLGLERDRFNGFFKDQTSVVRISRYLPCPIPDLALGVGRHKDPGLLTILAQDDVGGLEVKRNGEWIFLKPTPNAYKINIGDIVQVWSNDKYESVEHRAKVNSEKERFSTAYFFNPAPYTIVEPLEELVSKQNPAKYRAYSWGKFLAIRKNSNLKKLDVENLQISQFRKY